VRGSSTGFWDELQADIELSVVVQSNL